MIACTTTTTVRKGITLVGNHFSIIMPLYDIPLGIIGSSSGGSMVAFGQKEKVKS